MHQNQVDIHDLIEIFKFELDVSELNLVESDNQDSVSGWDSLAHVRIIAAIERKYDIQFDLDEIEEAISIKKIVEAISKHIGAR